MHALDPSNTEHNPDSGPPKERLRSAQVTQIYSQSLLGSLAATLGGIVFASALWIAEPHPQIIAWIVFYFSTSVAHFVVTKAFFRSKTTAENIVGWGRWHWAVTASGSLAWTYAVIFLFPTDLHLQIFMIIFVGGIVSGAAAIYSPTREYLTSNVVILMPLAGHFLYLGGGYNITIGLLLFMFGLVMFVVGNSVHRLYAELLGIRFEREDLIDDLSNQISVRKQVETDLREARDALELRVAERTAELGERNLALSEEIVERRKVEDALRASEDAYRSLSENIPGIVYRIWPDRKEVRFFGTGL
ncbi:MAG: hypothetical protein QG577_2769, partial [Thermodesulfobacteriota bacterium]|nr:hypothetical protein [Thermodesulfobacteriota bacterium]